MKTDADPQKRIADIIVKGKVNKGELELLAEQDLIAGLKDQIQKLAKKPGVESRNKKGFEKLRVFSRNVKDLEEIISSLGAISTDTSLSEEGRQLVKITSGYAQDRRWDFRGKARKDGQLATVIGNRNSELEREFYAGKDETDGLKEVMQVRRTLDRIADDRPTFE